MQLTDKITITQEDNMELMARYPDNYFDLAIVDPPYGMRGNVFQAVLNSDEDILFTGCEINDKYFFDTIEHLTKVINEKH